MQANKDQGWTDDADFWDEAWADMNARLDADAPNRRKGLLAWWPFFLGGAFVLLAGFLLASGITPRDKELVEENTTPLVNTTLRQGGQEETKPVASTPEAAQPLVTNETTPNSPKQKTPKTKATKNKLTNSQQPKRTNRVRTAALATAKTPSSNTPLASNSPANNPRVVAQESTPQSVLPPVNTSKVSPQNKAIKKAETPSPLLVPKATQLLTATTAYALPAVPSLRKNYHNTLAAEAAYTSSFGLQQPGFLLGLSYRINNGSKLSFPISLRYRLDELERKDLSDADADQTSVSLGTRSASFLNPVSVSADALEVGAGLAWSVTPRLRLGTGLSAAYQLRALVNFESTTNYSADDLNGIVAESTDQRFSVGFDRSENLLQSTNQESIPPDYSRWAMRASLGASYDITPRLGVGFKATHLLLQPDRNRVLEVNTGRMELGLSYRLR